MKFPKPTSAAAAAFAPTTRAALVAAVKAGGFVTSKAAARTLAATHCTGAATHVHVLHFSATGVFTFARVGKRGGFKVLHTFGPACAAVRAAAVASVTK